MAPPPPPPPPPPAHSGPTTPLPPAPRAAEDAEARAEETRSAHIAALRQYLQIHPDEPDAIRRLAGLLPAAEAERLMNELVGRSPEDPDVYHDRAAIRLMSGRVMEALDDYEMAGRLDSDNPERFYVLGVVAYEVAAKLAVPDETERRAIIARGLAALDRAESLRSDYFESIVYRSLLLREQAKLETDPVERQELIDQADALRQNAVDLSNSRRRKP